MYQFWQKQQHPPVLMVFAKSFTYIDTKCISVTFNTTGTICSKISTTICTILIENLQGWERGVYYSCVQNIQNYRSLKCSILDTAVNS